MDAKERVIKYLAGKMGSGEMEQFRMQLKSSTELRTIYEKTKLMMDDVDAVKKIRIDENYLAEVTEKAKSKIFTEKKRKLQYRPAYIVAGIAMLLILITFPFRSEKGKLFPENNGLQTIISDMDSVTLDSLIAERLATDFSYEIYDEDITAPDENGFTDIDYDTFAYYNNYFTDYNTSSILSEMDEDEYFAVLTKIEKINFNR